MQKATDAAHLEGNAELVGGHDFRQSQPYKGEGSLEVETIRIATLLLTTLTKGARPMSTKQPEPAPVLAASRSLYFEGAERRPVLCCHVLRADGFPACGLSGGGCGTIWVKGHPPVPAEEVAEGARCQRPGCKERWPAPVYK